MVFKDKIYGIMNNIPEFINTTDITHHHVWDMMTLINETILELVSLRILTKVKINGIVRRFNDYVTYTMCLLTDDVKLRFSIYYTSVLDWMLDECINEEYFESATNIRNFNELYYQMIEDDDNN